MFECPGTTSARAPGDRHDRTSSKGGRSRMSNRAVYIATMISLASAAFGVVAAHALRAIGATILVPTVLSGTVPREFAEPVAYGDLLTTVLAIVALIALRYGAGAAIGLAWIANVVGIVDLANALVQGIRFDA